MYKGIHGYRKIARKEYTITDEDTDEVLDERNWALTVQPGKQLSVNMILSAVSGADFQKCPRCLCLQIGPHLTGSVVVGELSRHPTGVDYRLHTPTSHMCQLTFRVVDKEVIVEDLPVTEKEEPSIVQSLETIEKSLIAVGTDNLTAMSQKSKSRHQKYRQWEEDSLFQRIHFYRDKLVTKRLQMGPDEIGSARQDYNVDLLPPLLKAAAKGDIEQLSGLIANDTKRVINSRVDIRMRYDDGGEPFSGWIFNGCTPLHIACWHGHLKIVNFLLDSGADVNTPDTDGDGPLWYVLGGSHINKL